MLSAEQQIAAFRKRKTALPAELEAAILPMLRQSADELADAIRKLAEASRITGDLIASITVTGPGQTSPAYSLGCRNVGGAAPTFLCRGIARQGFACPPKAGHVVADLFSENDGPTGV